MVRPCLVALRDGLGKMQRSFDSLCSLPSTALRAGRMTMGSAALTTSSLSDGQKSAGGRSQMRVSYDPVRGARGQLKGA